ncbi:type II secretion system protein N [Serratia ficaria]|uniref:type II secretion system protein N n=1 Tax=Serratia ficaria TaxID=61651 RepID=UPI002179AE31|nr:type II secretion system protein N [Serratia ficaria]CAI2092271.1 type II secretion system protein C [Serratia ficaria]
MNIKEMNFYSMASILKGKAKDIYLFFYGGLVVTGIVLLSFLCLDTLNTLEDEKGRLVLPDKAVAEVPSNLLQDKVAQIVSPRRLPDADDGRERFRIRPGVSDELLLLAPRATSSEKVVGILSSTQQVRSIAIIESGGAQKSYQIGERISGKSIILRILSDRVIINDNGYYASLIL